MSDQTPLYIVTEDDPTNQALLPRFVGQLPVQFQFFSHNSDADLHLQNLMSGDEGQPYNGAIIDFHTPKGGNDHDLSGTKLIARLLKNQAESGHSVVGDVIVLSSTMDRELLFNDLRTDYAQASGSVSELPYIPIFTKQNEAPLVPIYIALRNGFNGILAGLTREQLLHELAVAIDQRGEVELDEVGTLISECSRIRRDLQAFNELGESLIVKLNLEGNRRGIER